jgi:hypothetical protein
MKLAMCNFVQRCIFTALLAIGGLAIGVLAGQQPTRNQSGFIPVTVTDPLHRFVTGLDADNFVVLENGMPRRLTYFSNVDTHLAVAIVNDTPLPPAAGLKAGDNLIQASSIPEALRFLAASTSERKAIIITTPLDPQPLPAGIQVIQINPANASRAVVELRNQYLIRFELSDPAARVEVTLKQPVGLPPLTPVWAAAF